ncbi:LOW QUALITY PROTEIN: hypothetical protein V2J09_006492 [Rumex salicifolius]
MGAGSTKTALFGAALFLVFLSTVSGQSSSCSSYAFSQNREYATCVSLSQLNCFLHWTYHASNATADIAFRATGVSSTANWVAWALNPNGDGMAGAQACSGCVYELQRVILRVHVGARADANTQLTESALSFTVTGLTGESSGSQITIFATIQLPNNKTSVNHVWQVGPLSSGSSPAQHDLSSDHQSSKGTIDFLSGAAQAGGGGSRIKKKNIHGVLSALSWGTLMPLGFIIARYMRVFKSADPAWFYLHITCQTSAYVIGVGAWGLGLKLGSESPGVTYHLHRTIGIVLALLLRPNKDHKYRKYWNIYHHGVGYTVIILSIINVFKGLDILDPEKKWKTTYIAILIVLACIAVFLEVITWIVVIRRKKRDGPDPKYPYAAQNAHG